MEEHQPSQACLARALWPAGRTTFHLYATTIPRPPGDGHTDAESFYRALQRITKLPQDAHLEQAGVEISAATNG